jgi:hypothetical protein
LKIGEQGTGKGKKENLGTKLFSLVFLVFLVPLLPQLLHQKHLISDIIYYL